MDHDRITWVATGIVVIVLMSSLVYVLTHTQNQLQIPSQSEAGEVSRTVLEFGKKLQMVSISAPLPIATASMDEHYGPYVSVELLSRWKRNPEAAPGRAVSSPWPDRIEILSIQKVSDTSYSIKGSVIEVTSEEVESGSGSAAMYPVTLKVEKQNEKWLITEYLPGPYTETKGKLLNRA